MLQTKVRCDFHRLKAVSTMVGSHLLLVWHLIQLFLGLLSLSVDASAQSTLQKHTMSCIPLLNLPGNYWLTSTEEAFIIRCCFAGNRENHQSIGVCPNGT
jgi:hypothetical protein